MTLRNKIFSTLSLALVPLLPSLAFRAVFLLSAGLPADGDFSVFSMMSEQLSRYDWRIVGAIWMVFGLIGLFIAWPPSTPAYGNWLKATPWSPGKPLPRGGLAPGPWLWLSLAVSSLISWLLFDLSPLVAPVAFAGGWVIAALIITVRDLVTSNSEREFGGWPVVFFPVTAILLASLSSRPLEWLLPATATSMLIFHRNLVRLLFAWTDPRSSAQREKSQACHHCVWLHPEPSKLAINKIDFRPRLAFSIFMGIAVGLIGSHDFGIEGSLRFVLLFDTLVIVGAAVISLSMNFVALCPPISWWGRLRSGRLIIPAYDRMMVPALASIAIIGTMMILVVNEHITEGPAQVIALTVSTALAFAVLLCTGPDRTSWAMTAPGRMPTPSKTAASKRQNARGTYFRI